VIPPIGVTWDADTDWRPEYGPGCCHAGCPAVIRGLDAARCAVRLAGMCGGCACGIHPFGGTDNANRQ
jgi:hypothetical protein